MSLIDQGDVKNHLSSRHRTEIHLYPPATQPAARSSFVAEPGKTSPNPSEFTEDFLREHSFPGIPLASTDPLISSANTGAPAASKRGQA